MTKPSNTTIAIASLSVISAVLLFGWVLPEYPYTRRLSPSQAESLLEEYNKLMLSLTISLSKDPDFKPVYTDAQRMIDIRTKLTRAGYTFTSIPYDTTLRSAIQYPSYEGYGSKKLLSITA